MLMFSSLSETSTASTTMSSDDGSSESDSSPPREGDESVSCLRGAVSSVESPAGRLGAVSSACPCLACFSASSCLSRRFLLRLQKEIIIMMRPRAPMSMLPIQMLSVVGSSEPPVNAFFDPTPTTSSAAEDCGPYMSWITNAGTLSCSQPRKSWSQSASHSGSCSEASATAYKSDAFERATKVTMAPRLVRFNDWTKIVSKDSRVLTLVPGTATNIPSNKGECNKRLCSRLSSTVSSSASSQLGDCDSRFAVWRSRTRRRARLLFVVLNPKLLFVDTKALP